MSVINIPFEALLSSSSDCNTLRSFTIFVSVVLFLSTPTISAGKIFLSLFIFDRLKSFAIVTLPILKVIAVSVGLYEKLPFSSVVPVSPEFVV